MQSQPSSIKLKRQSKCLALSFNNGEYYELSFEYLRVFSPSAEVRGHGKGQEVLQWGKQHVCIKQLEAVGHYALKPSFDDGHDSGIYSWDYLYELCIHHEKNWKTYLQNLQDAQRPRDASTQILKL